MADEGLLIPQPRDLKERVFEEVKRFIVIFLYLWVVFALLSLHKSLVLTQRHLDYEEHTFAIINALVFAKVLLVAEDLHLGERFEKSRSSIRSCTKASSSPSCSFAFTS
jgi:membrane associated rhomboid family serine protease